VPWKNSTSYRFDRASVAIHAPPESGVYAIFAGTTWIYVGESLDIRAQLMEHLDGDNPCFTVFPGLMWSYELHLSETCAWRQGELVREFHPVCNSSWG